MIDLHVLDCVVHPQITKELVLDSTSIRLNNDYFKLPSHAIEVVTVYWFIEPTNQG
jgi:hypothetical protein